MAALQVGEAPDDFPTAGAFLAGGHGAPSVAALAALRRRRHGRVRSVPPSGRCAPNPTTRTRRAASSSERSGSCRRSPTPRSAASAGASGRCRPTGRPLVGWLREGLLAATGHGAEGILLGGGTGGARGRAGHRRRAAVRRGAVRPAPVRRRRVGRYRREAAGRVQQLEDAVRRHRVQRVAVAAHHGLRREQRVHDGLLGGLDRGREQLVQRTADVPRPVEDGADRHLVAGRRHRQPVRRRERDHLLARAVRRVRARRARGPCPPRTAIRRTWCGSSGASVATTTTQEPSVCSTGIRS